MCTRYVADIHDWLKPVAVASRSNKPIGDKMILSAVGSTDECNSDDVTHLSEVFNWNHGRVSSTGVCR